MPAAVDVVIVNWNAGRQLAECVAALGASEAGAALDITVVDNASRDGSADALAAGHAVLRVLKNPVNLGFGQACNQGAAEGRADAILFLNPDAVASAETVLAAAAFLRDHLETGIVGARLTSHDGATARSTARRPTARTLLAQSVGLDRLFPRRFPPHFALEWDHAETRAVDQVMGAFLTVRRTLFERLGGFDERFFVYFEDVDLCARARDAGSGVVHLAGIAAIHGGQGTTRQVKDRRLFFFLRSKALFVAKHHGGPAARRQLAVDLLLHLPIRVAAALLSRSLPDARASLRAGAMLLRDLPAILRATGDAQPNPCGGPSLPAHPSATARPSARKAAGRPPDTASQ